MALGALLYSLYLYFDFAGYCHIAIGTGVFWGIRLPENFNNPYIARNLAVEPVAHHLEPHPARLSLLSTQPLDQALAPPEDLSQNRNHPSARCNFPVSWALARGSDRLRHLWLVARAWTCVSRVTTQQTRGQ